MKHYLYLRLNAILVLLMVSLNATSSDLIGKIDSLIKGKRMTVGVATECNGAQFTFNDSLHFPLLSVFKVHVAMAAVDKMQNCSISADSIIHISKKQLHPNTYSPLKQAHPNSDINITLAELLKYSVALSDNNACDILIDFVGGINLVDSYIRNLGISGFRLCETELSMHSNIQRCRNNWSRPSCMLSVLKTLFESDNEGFGLICDIMHTTVTGPDKIPAGTPNGIKVAHKTGSSDRTEGIKIADNDAGVIFLPDAKCYVVVFIMDSSESDQTNAETIAEITHEIITYYKNRHI